MVDDAGIEYERLVGKKKTAVAMSSPGSGASMGFHGLSCQL